MHLFPSQTHNTTADIRILGSRSLKLQDHKVFARHNEFGKLEVPKQFLNTNKKAPAAMVPTAVRQARRARMFPL